MPIFEVKTKVYKEDSGEFIGNSSASWEAEDKDDAKWWFHHGIILANTPEGLKIKGDLRTLKQSVSST